MTTTAGLPISASHSFAEPIYGLRLQCPQCEEALDPIRQPTAGGGPLLRCSACLFVLPMR